MKRLSNKLNHMKLKSFEILEKKKLINYELNFSTFMKICHDFSMCYLKDVEKRDVKSLR